MSGGLDVLAMKEDDVTKLLAAGSHLGDPNLDHQMLQYVYKRKPDGVPIINIRKTWEKLLLAARVIAAVENPSDVCVLSNRPFGQRAVLKFAKYTGATAVVGRFTPGTFTNQIQAAFKEPRLLVISDPRTDHQPVTEGSYVNIPVIAFANTSSPLRYIDIAIPCNNTGKNSLGLMWWLLSREVLRLRGTISRDLPWEVMPDLFFYRDPEEIEKEEQQQIVEMELAAAPGDQWAGVGAGTEGLPAQAPTLGDTKPTWETKAEDWGAEMVAVPPGPPVAATAPPVATGPPPPLAPPTQQPYGSTEQDWNVAPTTSTTDWAADEGEWGSAEPQATTGNW